MEHKEDKEDLEKENLFQILFVHALLGCDTTSRVFGIGKPVALKQVQNNVDFQQYTDLFTKDGAAKKYIIDAGEKALVYTYIMARRVKV